MILPPATDNKALIASYGVPDYLVTVKIIFGLSWSGDPDLSAGPGPDAAAAAAYAGIRGGSGGPVVALLGRFAIVRQAVRGGPKRRQPPFATSARTITVLRPRP